MSYSSNTESRGNGFYAYQAANESTERMQQEIKNPSTIDDFEVMDPRLKKLGKGCVTTLGIIAVMVGALAATPAGQELIQGAWKTATGN